MKWVLWLAVVVLCGCITDDATSTNDQAHDVDAIQTSVHRHPAENATPPNSNLTTTGELARPSANRTPSFDVQVGPEHMVVFSEHAGQLLVHNGVETPRNLTVSEASTTVGYLQPSTTYHLTFFCNNKDSNCTNWKTSATTLARQWQWADPPNATIFPGMSTGGGTVTAILREPTNETLYILITGHQRSGAREIPNDPFFPVFMEDNETQDWAIWGIKDEYRHQASPTIHHWTGPAGVIHPREITRDDTLCFIGWGMQTTEGPVPRCGDLVRYVREMAAVNIPINAGDSGGPLIDYRTGQLLGYLRGDGVSGSYFLTLCTAKFLWEAAGFDFQVATATYSPPPPEFYVAGRPSPGPTSSPNCNPYDDGDFHTL